ncbi:MAG TPA: hypothetical protein PLL10_06660 [Elusimicrobiales bacterium]|nr:hypothetical protein [Elusimicrobiales bacterium]
MKKVMVAMFGLLCAASPVFAGAAASVVGNAGEQMPGSRTVAAPAIVKAAAPVVDPIYDDAAINKLVDSQKTGYAKVFVNGKLTLTSLRECALARTSIATESTDFDVLTIMLSGKPLANDYGINALGKVFGNKTFWDGPVFFNPSGAAEAFKVDGGHGYKYCNGVCKKGSEGYGVKLVISGKTKIELTSTIYEVSGKVKEKTVSCVMDEAAADIEADIHEAMQEDKN